MNVYALSYQSLDLYNFSSLEGKWTVKGLLFKHISSQKNVRRTPNGPALQKALDKGQNLIFERL